MFVPFDRMEEAAAIAKGSMESVSVGEPSSDGTIIGPVVSEVQWNKIQALIEAGIEEGATLVTGGLDDLRVWKAVTSFVQHFFHECNQ